MNLFPYLSLKCIYAREMSSFTYSKKVILKKKRERDWQNCKKESRLQKLNETELLQMRMPYSKLFIAREELLSSALTHPAIRHPSKYIHT